MGGKTRAAETAEKIMNHKEEEVSMKALAEVAPILKPDQVAEAANQRIEHGNPIDIRHLSSIAPFLSREDLEKILEKMGVSSKNISEIVAVAPFISKSKILDEMVEKALELHVKPYVLTGLAPFLSKKAIQKIIDFLIANGKISYVQAFAPFAGKEGLAGIANGSFSGAASSGGETGFCEEEILASMDEIEIAKLAYKEYSEGKPVEKYLDYMEEEDVAKLAERAVKAGRDATAFLDYMDGDDVGALAKSVAEAGGDVTVFLDYMDGEAAGEVAQIAVEHGQPVEPFLDYLDEEDMKQLVLQLLRKKNTTAD